MSRKELESEKESQKDLGAKLNVLRSQEQERLAERRAEELGLPYVSLFTFPLDPDILERVPKSTAEELGLVLFQKNGKDVRVAAVTPEREEVEAEVKRIGEELGATVQMYVISDRSLQSALTRYRRERTEEAKADDEMEITNEEIPDFNQAAAKLEEMGQNITALAPTEIVRIVVAGAVAMGASDIHVEPTEKRARLRYRVDGVLKDIVEFDRGGWKLIVSRVKALSGLKLNIHEVPQDGSFVLKIGDAVYDIRVSILPGGNGENVVMRLLNRKAEAVALKDLGMKQRDLDLVARELKRTNGMILMTGPTGSGKTTSLASFLRDVNQPEMKVITLEDPIEYRIAGVEQTQVDVDAGYTFAAGLRSILRQDPDVIMVGEMRDTETAEVAMHAALTGHLVFSTLHTNDAPGAVVRLMDMGIAPYIIAPAVNMIVAQRLVRKVCSKCAEPYSPDDEERRRIASLMEGVTPDVFDPALLKDQGLQFMKAVGCEACGGGGYKGRVGIFEIFAVAGELEELVLNGADTAQIREGAIHAGMTTILQDGLLKVIGKVTTTEEVERVTEE